MKKRYVLKSLKKTAVQEALIHKEKGIVTIIKTKCGKKYIVRIDTKKNRLGILIDRLEGPFNTWCLPLPKEIQNG